ncbi:MAG TPA: peptidoglycan DD-metalloendopeptidase family protein [Deinococcales bacterium]|nr:peptidoglycan DD-metalloendopeptidase family protein [Deinococcales bacterium]
MARRFLPAVLTLLLLAVAAPVANAQEVDTSRRDALESEIEDYERLLEQRSADIDNIQTELGETAAALQARIAERDQVAAEISSLRTQRADLQAQIAQLELDLEATAADIDRILGNLDSLLGRISALLVNLYTRGASRYAEALSQATSYHDFQVRSHYLSLLTEQDVTLVNELNDTRAELLEAQQQQRDQLEAQSAAEDELRRNEETLLTQEANLQGIIGELESTRAGQQAQEQALMEAQNEIESTLSSLAGQLQAEIRRLREEEERLRREAAEAFLEERERESLLEQAEETRSRIENLTEPLLPTSSDFAWPVDGPTIASSYGTDNNSYLALKAVSANAPVRAMEAGVVTSVLLLSANDGYLVGIQHASDLIVSYTNLQRPVVQVGQRVSKGELLGHLGGGALVAPDILKLWVTAGGTFVDPQARLGF